VKAVTAFGSTRPFNQLPSHIGATEKAMDFFAQQDRARRKTKWLVIYFALAVASMIVMIYGVAIFVSFYVALKGHPNYYASQAPVAFWNPLCSLV